MLTWELICALLRHLFVAFLAVLVFFFCYIKAVHMRYDHIPGAPRPSFLFGHLPIMWKMLKNQELYFDVFVQWAEKYGPIVRVNAFHKIALLIFSPEGIKEFLMSPQYPKDPIVYGSLYYICGERFLGNGLTATLDYEHWHKQRRIMDPAFSRTYLMGLLGIFNDKAEELMKELAKKADGKTEVNVMSLLEKVTLDIIAKAAFGMDLNTLQDDQAPFPRAVAMVMIGMSNKRMPLFEYLPWNRKQVKEIRESVRLLRRTGRECFERRRKLIQNGEDPPQDILTQILKNSAQAGDCDEENMLDNFVNFFVAGRETSANQMSFAVMELGRHPEIVAKLQAEVDEVLGAREDVAYEDLGKLKYLSQVLKETLRLYPPAAATLRRPKKDTIIEGINIPKNTTLIFSTYVMGRLEKFFKDPLVFNPDRFRKDQPRKPNKGTS
ncbi:cholesterol 24-hydroxylase-like isoform X2 [Hemicordylus capensis]|uniref:cholesterol 24-hydroxylase-like isoform X2 n=1 Tax=Hemicordylus capensis TaxID=884348 RepID=UPI0023022376|nr:cholesterol 24-hydroxylase-like isoform X2 [Hemicordylus capensis]